MTIAFTAELNTRDGRCIFAPELEVRTFEKVLNEATSRETKHDFYALIYFHLHNKAERTYAADPLFLFLIYFPH